MNGLLELFTGQGVVGQVVKHLIPWDGINKAIPILNALGGIAYMKTQGADWGTAATTGIIGALGIGKLKDSTKGVMPKNFKGLGFHKETKKLTFVNRSF